ncbi:MULTISPECIES: pentapeptide repeat-containing protein [unclassified Streptomyces]|uniref:pentapeptide repeat-containing protein n=1 Tax=unclassified Streptomyces TaxID=2593676 RepID=UPI002E2B0ADC|nr:pentapeptide repeat-containing protein [Streptomyces sp. NBC_00285]
MTPVGSQRDVYKPPITKPARPKVHPDLRQAEAEEFENDATLRAVLLNGTVLSGNVELCDIENSRLSNARFIGASLRQSVLSDSEFDTVDFANFRAQDVSLLRCTVSTSRLTGSHWQSGQFTDVTFEGGRADMALFRGSKLKRVVFQNVILQQADFQGAELTHVVFDGCNVTGGQFANATMKRVEFNNCTMLDIGGTAGLKGATVRGPGALELALSLARDAGIAIEQ